MFRKILINNKEVLNFSLTLLEGDRTVACAWSFEGFGDFWLILQSVKDRFSPLRKLLCPTKRWFPQEGRLARGGLGWPEGRWWRWDTGSGREEAAGNRFQPVLSHRPSPASGGPWGASARPPLHRGWGGAAREGGWKTTVAGRKWREKMAAGRALTGRWPPTFSSTHPLTEELRGTEWNLP